MPDSQQQNPPSNPLLIAVDGGAASGKSSTSSRIAERFNLLHVDTGSHYRAVTFTLASAGISHETPDAVAEFLRKVPLETETDGRKARICLNGTTPVDGDLRSEAVNRNVSQFAALPCVRQFLFEYQRSQPEVAAAKGFRGMIMEGRDIGSVIFPDAPFRFFLEADPEKRAQRRLAEGHTDAVAERDKLDQSRKTAPLVCPTGATRIDSSHLTLEEVVEKVAAMIEAAAG